MWKPQTEDLFDETQSWTPITDRLKQRTWDIGATDYSQPSPSRTSQDSGFTPYTGDVYDIPSYTPSQKTSADILQALEGVVPEAYEGMVSTKEEYEKTNVPFWKRALELFAMPFNFIDDNIISPALAVVGTTLGFTPDVERLEGEDFWEWKKRSWGEWRAPGVDVSVPWSDTPIRIDFKGILEIAPWLLIPGAGEVGTATRTAHGLAGALGKAGAIGKTLGYTIQYSPWGLVEKGIGTALKSSVKGVFKGTKKLSDKIEAKLFGEYIPPPERPVVTKFIDSVEQTVMPAYKDFRKEVGALRSRQEAATQAVRQRWNAGGYATKEEYYKALKDAMTGGVKDEFAITTENLLRRQSEAIKEIEAKVASGSITTEAGDKLIKEIYDSPIYKTIHFTEAEGKEILDLISQAHERGLVNADEATAVIDLLMNGTLLEKGQMKALVPIFGERFAQAIESVAKTGKMESFLEAVNLTRALQSAFDLSGTMRQGFILTLMHPLKAIGWFKHQIKALFSEKYAQEIYQKMVSDPRYKIYARVNGYSAPLDSLASMAVRDESFMTKWARSVPGISQSERAFITYTNLARFESWCAMYDVMLAMGKAGEKDLQMLAKFVNEASGRGSLPKNIEKYAPFLNAFIYSPRLQAATMQLPFTIGKMLLSENPYLRQTAARALVTFMGAGTAAMSIAHLAGAKVSLDPRAVDFGKITIGNTQLDIWRGYVQYVRLGATLLTGERKSAYGNLSKVDKMDTAIRFVQSKSSPAFGLLFDLFKGESYMGEPIFDSTGNLIKAARERLMPFALQDIMEAMEAGGINSSWVAAPATLGIGALTMVNELAIAQNKVAKEMGYESWEDIDPKTQKTIMNRSAELQAAQIKFDRDMMGTAFGDWRLVGNAIEEVFADEVETAVKKFRATGDGYQFRLDVNEAFTARRGAYNARNKDERFADIVKRMETPDMAESMVNLSPEMLAIKTYNQALYGDDMTDELGDYRFDEAKVRREKLKEVLGEDLYAYAEDFQGLKYETLPQEFQELAKAKEVMRGYWEIKEKVYSIWGEPKNALMQKNTDRIISRLRKQMRALDKNVAYYYDMFYKAK